MASRTERDSQLRQFRHHDALMLGLLAGRADRHFVVDGDASSPATDGSGGETLGRTGR